MTPEQRLEAKKIYLEDIRKELQEANDYLSVYREGLPLGVVTMILEGISGRYKTIQRLKEEIEILERKIVGTKM